MKILNTFLFCFLLFSCNYQSEKQIPFANQLSDFEKFLDYIPEMELPYFLTLEGTKSGNKFKSNIVPDIPLLRDKNEIRLKHKFLQIPFFTRSPPALFTIGKFDIHTDMIGVICVSDYGGGVGFYLRVFDKYGNNLDILQLGGAKMGNWKSNNWKEGGFQGAMSIDFGHVVASISSNKIIKQELYELVKLEEPLQVEGGGYRTASLQVSNVNYYKIDKAGKFKLTKDYHEKG